MKKILITGSTSSQCSRSSNNRNIKFGGLLNDALSFGFENQVVFAAPSVTMKREEVEQYDAVLVGLAPLTSMSSHYMYGALSVLGHALDIGNGSIFLDSPEPHTVFSSLRNCAKSEKNLFKSFFSSRAEFCELSESSTRHHILKTARRISNCQESLKVISSALPWSSGKLENYKIDLGDFNYEMLAMNLDCFALSDSVFSFCDSLPAKTKRVWHTDNKKNTWVKSVSATITGSVEDVRKKYAARDEVLMDMSYSLGYLLPIYKYDQPWWSSNIINSLISNTPVFTDWKLSSPLGSSWSQLPSHSEGLPDSERVALAKQQLNDYVKHIPDKVEASSQIENYLL